MITGPDLLDLAQHLAYHASIGFAECRELEIPADGEPNAELAGRTDGNDAEFTVSHGGVKFLITVERLCGD